MMYKKKLLVFHPTIAPYRIDLFNSLCESFDTRICLFYRNLKSQQFNYSKIESHFNFVPVYLKDSSFKLFGRTIYRGIWRQIKAFGPDIVIVCEFSMCSICVLAYKKLFRRQFKVITICDDSYDMVARNNDFSKWHRWSRKLVVPMLDELILVEPRTVEWYQQNYGKGIFFPIIRDDKKQRDIYRQLYDRSVETKRLFKLVGKFTFLFVGRLVALKNVENIIISFSYIKNNSKALVIIGDGPEKGKLKEIANKNNCEVLFLDRLEGDELYQWYNIADCFILASKQESFGAVTNEALLAGCWCLISDKAGSRCLIDDGKNGYTFNPDSVSELRNKMELSIDKAISIDKTKIRDNLMKYSYKSLIVELIGKLYNIGKSVK